MLKSAKTALLLLVLIIIFPLLAIGIRTGKSALWDGVNHINIVIDSQNIRIWSVDPSSKSIYELIIPDNIYLSVSSYGEYRAKAIGKLSLLEKKGGALLIESLNQSLGVPVDMSIIKKDDASPQIDPRDFFGIPGLINIIKTGLSRSYITNATALDIFRLWMFSFQINKEAIEKVDLADSDAVSKIVLPDGSEGLTVDTDRLSIFLSDFFTDSIIKNENLTIEVLNATKQEGRANKLAFVLNTIGGTVINTAKKEQAQSETIIYSVRSSYTAEKIAKMTQGKLILEPPSEGRADILVVLGGE